MALTAEQLESRLDDIIGGLQEHSKRLDLTIFATHVTALQDMIDKAQEAADEEDEFEEEDEDDEDDT